MQIDINECLFGLIGAFTNKLTRCEWSTYYVNHALLSWKIHAEEWGHTYWDTGCGEVRTYDA